MSDSLRPHGPYPTRLLCPWDSPHKNTGVVCHFLLQGIFLIQESNHVFHVSCIERRVLYHWQHLGSPIMEIDRYIYIYIFDYWLHEHFLIIGNMNITHVFIQNLIDSYLVINYSSHYCDHNCHSFWPTQPNFLLFCSNFLFKF